jgi:hypothetical protein
VAREVERLGRLPDGLRESGGVVRADRPRVGRAGHPDGFAYRGADRGVGPGEPSEGTEVRTGKRRDRGDLRVRGSRPQRDPPADAVPDEGEASDVDAVGCCLGLEERHRRVGVVLRAAPREGAAAPPRAAVVHEQRVQPGRAERRPEPEVRAAREAVE